MVVLPQTPTEPFLPGTTVQAPGQVQPTDGWQRFGWQLQPPHLMEEKNDMRTHNAHRIAHAASGCSRQKGTRHPHGHPADTSQTLEPVRGYAMGQGGLMSQTN